MRDFEDTEACIMFLYGISLPLDNLDLVLRIQVMARVLLIDVLDQLCFKIFQSELTLKHPKFTYWFNQSFVQKNDPVLKLFFSLLSINSAEAEEKFNHLELLPGLWTYLLKSEIAIWSEEILFKKALEYAKAHQQAKPYDSLSHIQYSILSSDFLVGALFLATNMKKVWLNSGPQFNFDFQFDLFWWLQK